MSEHQMETRRRSRSKTPFLRSNCDHETCEHAGEEGHTHHHHPKKKAAVAPTVQTIIEERPASKTQYVSTTTVITSSQRSKTPSPLEKNKEIDLSPKVTSSTSSSTVITKSRKIIDNLISSTPKASSIMQENYAAEFSTGGGDSFNRRIVSEVTQNELNTEFERSQNSASRINRNNTSEWKKTTPNILNGDLSDHIPYREYKLAGEYWNKTPKTDYTYSKLSLHRRELAPGIVAMPNMSRRSLGNHDDRVYHMIERNPAQEEQIRKRYTAQQHRYTENRKATERLLFDSGDETDYSKFENYVRSRQLNLSAKKEQRWWFMRFITMILSTVTSVWTENAVDETKLYRTNYYEQKRGFWDTIKYGFLKLLRYIYLCIASVLYMDTWLLQSNNVESKGRKRFLIFLLCLLPLLLLGAWYLLDEPQRQYSLQKGEILLPYSEPAHVHLHNMELNLQRTGLTTEEYQNILNHINIYVQKLVDVKVLQQQEAQKLEAQQITPQQTEYFVKIVRENIENLAREKRSIDNDRNKFIAMSDEELDFLAQRVKMNLELNGWAERPVRLSQENLGEIKRLIAQHIQLNNDEYYSLFVERVDLDALLERLLSSSQLIKIVDSRIDAALASGRYSLREGSANDRETTNVDAQQRLIDELNSEIAFIKLALADKNAENADLHRSISKLKVSQDDILERLQQHEFATDARFSSLLAEIQEKIAALHEKQFTLLNRQIKLSLIEILGFKQTEAGSKLEDVDLKSWVHSMFVAKDYLEERLQVMNIKTNERIKDEIDRSGMVLFRDISERLKEEIITAVERKHNESIITLKGEIRAALSEEEVRNIVKSVLAIYDADKTGLVDFALESAGGQILSTRCTESYQVKSAQISIFGIPLWYPSNTPRIAISPKVQPGECWAFQGFPGFLVLKLNSLVYVTGFTLEHIPRSLSPNGRIDSAPRNFTVWGLEHEKDQDPVPFGEYEYSDNDAALQFFPVQNRDIKRPYEIVELRIETNHGHPQYTCLYRFRVHGKPPAT